eukprot:CAMPEP_0113958736 /NCGR_PEP_ID=MMETSP0011_2-20120614/3667_1 /TAXON_ID=101924 /ORGANISM="Rhodosorus marinus" /LENGTH=419 /DNA_ID=CAMNT_0000969795 /DNA_START=271 /DNA_END=1530 /DNA_ORIENTATION=+ /assembly_acc=CAM_ASM_000156
MRTAFAAYVKASAGRISASEVISQPPHAAYVHIPFCRQRCHYCDFPIVVTGDRLEAEKRANLHKNYFNALIREIGLEATSGRPRRALTSVYFGGGTPSLASARDISNVLHTLDSVVGLEANCEVTLEMDPGTFDLAKAGEFQSIGINRASVGAQTFNSELLKLCGRAHSVDEIYQAVENIRSAGIQNFSMDLIGGLPTQNLETFKDSLEELIRLNPSHLSVYDLIIEYGTKFGRLYSAGNLPLPSEEHASEMYRMASIRLQEAGYVHYETSSFALEGFQSAHNQTYWRNEPYFGFGLGAASFLDGNRFKRDGRMRGYMDWVSTASKYEDLEMPVEEAYTFQSEVEEFIMLGLRTARGLNFEELCGRFDRDIAENVFKSLKMQERHHVHIEDGKLARLTSPEGFLVQNAIIVDALKNLPF